MIGQRRWKIFQYDGWHHDGLWFSVFRAPAYIAEDGEHWDFAEGAGRVFVYQDPWQDEESERQEEAVREIYSKAMQKWDTLDQNKAWFEEFVILPYENILAIDETGDEFLSGPHIYVGRFERESGPFLPGRLTKLESAGRFSEKTCDPDPDKRVEIFERMTSRDK